MCRGVPFFKLKWTRSTFGGDGDGGGVKKPAHNVLHWLVCRKKINDRSLEDLFCKKIYVFNGFIITTFIYFHNIDT